MEDNAETSASAKRIVIMRGLPSCGKSTRAKELAGETGLIFSTDEYWYKVNHPEKPDEYSFNPQFLSGAHKWNQVRAQQAMNIGSPLIIIDNTNTTAGEFCCDYARYARWQDYEVVVEEPTSPWWLEIRELLRNKRANKKALKEWAKKLETLSLKTHKVPFFAIERMMWRWETNLDIDAIIQNCVDNHPLKL